MAYTTGLEGVGIQRKPKKDKTGAQLVDEKQQGQQRLQGQALAANIAEERAKRRQNLAQFETGSALQADANRTQAGMRPKYYDALQESRTPQPQNTSSRFANDAERQQYQQMDARRRAAFQANEQAIRAAGPIGGQVSYQLEGMESPETMTMTTQPGATETGMRDRLAYNAARARELNTETVDDRPRYAREMDESLERWGMQPGQKPSGGQVEGYAAAMAAIGGGPQAQPPAQPQRPTSAQMAGMNPDQIIAATHAGLTPERAAQLEQRISPLPAQMAGVSPEQMAALPVGAASPGYRERLAGMTPTTMPVTGMPNERSVVEPAPEMRAQAPQAQAPAPGGYEAAPSGFNPAMVGLQTFDPNATAQAWNAAQPPAAPPVQPIGESDLPGMDTMRQNMAALRARQAEIAAQYAPQFPAAAPQDEFLPNPERDARVRAIEAQQVLGTMTNTLDPLNAEQANMPQVPEAITANTVGSAQRIGSAIQRTLAATQAVSDNPQRMRSMVAGHPVVDMAERAFRAAQSLRDNFRTSPEQRGWAQSIIESLGPSLDALGRLPGQAQGMPAPEAVTAPQADSNTLDPMDYDWRAALRRGEMRLAPQ